MNHSVLMPLASMMFSLILFISVMLKKNKNDSFRRSFHIFLSLTFLAPAMEIVYFLFPAGNYALKVVSYKVFLVEELLWVNLFLILMIVIAKKISNDSDRIEKRKLRKYNAVFLPLYLGISLAIILLPLEINNIGTINSHACGPALKLFYYVVVILAFIGLLAAFKGTAKSKSAKVFTPFLLFIVISVISLMIQSSYQSVMLLTTSQVLVSYMIYFSFKENKYL